MKGPRLFECQACHRVLRGLKRVKGRQVIWTPRTHGKSFGNSEYCPGSFGEAIITDPALADAYAPQPLDPDGDDLIASATNVHERRFFENVVYGRAASSNDKLFGRLLDIFALHRYELGRRTDTLPGIGFEPGLVTIEFGSREDLVRILGDFVRWLSADTSGEFERLIEPKRAGEE